MSNVTKFPKLKYPSDSETDGVLDGEVVVTEKLDGANFRLTVTEDEEVYIGTRNHEYHIDDENIPTAFGHAVEWVRENVVNDDVTRRTLSGVGTLFGEAMHLHSLEYDDVEYENPSSGSPYFADPWPSVVFFDWYTLPLDIDKEYTDAYAEWAHWDSFTDLADTCMLPMVKVVARGDGKELREKDLLSIPDESVFGGSPEGIVVRRVDGTVRAKKVSDDFKEVNSSSFNDPSNAQSESGAFVARFVTDARIEKLANKLIDEGEYEQLEMPMMEQLPRRVIQDVFAEEGWNLVTNEYGFECEFDEDFKDELRSKVSKKCSRVLRQLCQEF